MASTASRKRGTAKRRRKTVLRSQPTLPFPANPGPAILAATEAPAARDADRHEKLLGQLDRAIVDLDLARPDEVVTGEVPVGQLRRRGVRRIDDGVGVMSLIERDGVLHWEPGLRLTIGAEAGRRRRAGAMAVAGEVVTHYKFRELAPSQVIGFLNRLDDKLTPARGLRRVNVESGTLEPAPPPRGEGKALLLVHGTFCNAENLVGEIHSTEAGRAFLRSAARAYGRHVYGFDHPTLGVSPLLNALDLAGALADFTGVADVVCHSRGGLVSSWWARAMAERGVAPGRIVCVASPLSGTSLAAPPRLKGALSLVTNIGRALGVAALAVPFLTAAAGLMKVLTSITGTLAGTPLTDAAVAMIPGLSGQSRVGNNPELLRLLDLPAGDTRFFAVTSNFEPDSPGWKFWRYFRDLGGRVADLGADVVFGGPNDLVVDTESMTRLGEDASIQAARVHAFGTNGRVHHCNYFEQPATIAHIREALEL